MRPTYGVVVNLQPLYEQRGRYGGDGRGAGCAVIAKQRYEARANSPTSATWRSAWCRRPGAMAPGAPASRRAVGEVSDGCNARDMGPAITGWAAGPSGTSFDALASQQSVIVQMVFPHELQAAAGHEALSVAPVPSRSAQRSARFLSASPQTDVSLPGATYFYIVDGQGLRAGMRVAGVLKLGGKARTGVAVPEAAVVWHGGKAWRSSRRTRRPFARKLVAPTTSRGAWLNVDGFASGDEVVIRARSCCCRRS